jgi:hypothetical protein
MPRAPIVEGMHMMNMKFPRRHFLHLAASAAALPAMSRVAVGQAYLSLRLSTTDK